MLSATLPRLPLFLLAGVGRFPIGLGGRAQHRPQNFVAVFVNLKVGPIFGLFHRPPYHGGTACYSRPALSLS